MLGSGARPILTVIDLHFRINIVASRLNRPVLLSHHLLARLFHPFSTVALCWIGTSMALSNSPWIHSVGNTTLHRCREGSFRTNRLPTRLERPRRKARGEAHDERCVDEEGCTGRNVPRVPREKRRRLTKACADRATRHHRHLPSLDAALFDFQSFLCVVLLVICTCTYIRDRAPAVLNTREGFRGVFWKASRIGERMSPWVSLGCIAMGIKILFW